MAKASAAAGKASNPGALDVLGDLVESTGSPSDAGLLATKGSLKQRQQPSKGGQIMLSVAPPARRAAPPAAPQRPQAPVASPAPKVQ